MRMKRRPIAIIRRSCSDSLMIVSQMDRVFGSDSRGRTCYHAGDRGLSHLERFAPKILPIELDQVEGVQDHLGFRLGQKMRIAPHCIAECFRVRWRDSRMAGS